MSSHYTIYQRNADAPVVVVAVVADVQTARGEAPNNQGIELS